MIHGHVCVMPLLPLFALASVAVEVPTGVDLLLSLYVIISGLHGLPESSYLGGRLLWPSCSHSEQNCNICIFSNTTKSARVMQSEVGTGNSINSVDLANVFVAQTQAWYTSYRKTSLTFVYFVEHGIVKLK